jgi:hypothetical protein
LRDKIHRHITGSNQNSELQLSPLSRDDYAWQLPSTVVQTKLNEIQQCEISELNGFNGSEQSDGKNSEESDENLLKDEIINFS